MELLYGQCRALGAGTQECGGTPAAEREARQWGQNVERMIVRPSQWYSPSLTAGVSTFIRGRIVMLEILLLSPNCIN